MKYCKQCNREIKKGEETFKNGICLECYTKYLYDKVDFLASQKNNPSPEKTNKIKEFFKKFFN